MTGRQFGAWLLSATIGPVLSIVGSGGWITTAITVIVCVALDLVVLSCKQMAVPRWLCVVELLWLVLFLGSVAEISAGCWLAIDTLRIIPIVLLLLAAMTAKDGVARLGRIGATLIWLIIPVLGIVMLAGTADADLAWVKNQTEAPNGMLIALLLTPCLGGFLPREESKSASWAVVLLGVITVAASLLMEATLGPEVDSAANVFYEFSKGINLFGVAERFEALVACVLTISWFSLFIMVVGAAFNFAEQILPATAKWSAWLVVLTAGALMWILPDSRYGVAAGSLIFWVFPTLITQGLGGEKKMEKK